MVRELYVGGHKADLATARPAFFVWERASLLAARTNEKGVGSAEGDAKALGKADVNRITRRAATNNPDRVPCMFCLIVPCFDDASFVYFQILRTWSKFFKFANKQVVRLLRPKTCFTGSATMAIKVILVSSFRFAAGKYFASYGTDQKSS